MKQLSKKFNKFIQRNKMQAFCDVGSIWHALYVFNLKSKGSETSAFIALFRYTRAPETLAKQQFYNDNNCRGSLQYIQIYCHPRRQAGLFGIILSPPLLLLLPTHCNCSVMVKKEIFLADYKNDNHRRVSVQQYPCVLTNRLPYNLKLALTKQNKIY